LKNFTLKFKGYKSFKGMQKIEFRPITVLLGPNSAGKSSIIKLLAMLKQTVHENSPSGLVVSGSQIDLGAFSSITHLGKGQPVELRLNIPAIENGVVRDHSVAHDIDLKLVFNDAQNYEGVISSSKINPLKYSVYYEDQDGFPLSYGIVRISSKEAKGLSKALRDGLSPQKEWLKTNKVSLPNYTSIEHLIGNMIEKALMPPTGEELLIPKNLGFGAGFLLKGFGAAKDTADLSEYASLENPPDLIEHWSKLSIQIQTRDEQHLLALEDHLEDYCRVLLQPLMASVNKRISDGLDDTRTNFRKFGRSIELLPAVRPVPQKYYTLKQLRELTMIWPNDWNLWHQAVNKLLQSLGLNGAIEVSCISEEEKLYKIHIIDLQTGFRSELSDVGYGFSQILPMVFSKLATNKTMIFEQPELHLHPLAQSNFAEFLLGEPVLKYHEKGEVKFTYYDEFPRPEGAEVAIALERLYNSNQYIIETHSEHVLRGLQVQIAKKNIKISDVAVYYVDRNSQGAGRVKELELQPNGFFKNPIPEGFFDSSTKLLEQLWLEQAT
jgi:hypothetical protein